MPVLNFGQPQDGVIQTAFITDNIEQSMAEMTALLNIGPWFLFEKFQLGDLHFRGEPAEFEVTLALANSGHMQFELIMPLDDKPSPYREAQMHSGWGFHHYGLAVTDFEAACLDFAARGYEQVLSATVAIGARAAYFDTRHPLFGMAELIEMRPEVEALWTLVRHASVGWDGADPVRTLE
ncbi:MAG: VOC family protein [Halieaceae bacterium]|nr:VOC family protein [Halieaceae bacterium]